jgi:hypothetical protein
MDASRCTCIGTTTDKLAQVKKSKAEPATTAKGDVYAEASTVK